MILCQAKGSKQTSVVCVCNPAYCHNYSHGKDGSTMLGWMWESILFYICHEICAQSSLLLIVYVCVCVSLSAGLHVYDQAVHSAKQSHVDMQKLVHYYDNPHLRK
jgi:hypothetical protein